MDLPMFLWMFIALKIPVIAALILVWYAIQEPDPEPAAPEDDGGSRRDHPWSPRGHRPPRRGGPHGAPEPRPPERVRVARGRTLERERE